MSSLELITTIVAGALLAAALYTLYMRDKRRDQRILSEMGITLFPRLSENLRAISEGLEGRETPPTRHFEEQLYNGLSKSLLIEFRLRYQRQGEMLDTLKEDLAKYDEASLGTGESQGAEALETMKLKLQNDISQLLKEIEELKKTERIPTRRPRLP